MMLAEGRQSDVRCHGGCQDEVWVKDMLEDRSDWSRSSKEEVMKKEGCGVGWRKLLELVECVWNRKGGPGPGGEALICL
jgi:hypothetical protein